MSSVAQRRRRNAAPRCLGSPRGSVPGHLAISGVPHLRLGTCAPPRRCEPRQRRRRLANSSRRCPAESCGPKWWWPPTRSPWRSSLTTRGSRSRLWPRPGVGGWPRTPTPRGCESPSKRWRDASRREVLRRATAARQEVTLDDAISPWRAGRGEGTGLRRQWQRVMVFLDVRRSLATPAAGLESPEKTPDGFGELSDALVVAVFVALGWRHT